MSALDDLIPELAGKPVAFTPGGFVLARLPKELSSYLHEGRLPGSRPEG